MGWDAQGVEKEAVDPDTLYDKQHCIGGGSFGRVYKGVDRRTGQTVAIKIVEIEGGNDDVRDIIEEISILAGLNSPYTTKYFGSYLKGSDLWIIMEFCSGGSCSDLMKAGNIAEEYIAIVLKELLMGLEYLHGDNKLHRDIKAANILLGANGQVKLADFGVSGQLSATVTKKNTFVGTPFWMAPEVIKQNGYDHKADIWSLGITAIELANGEPPFADIHPMKVLFLIPKHPPPRLEGGFSPAFKDFVTCCLKKDPKERPTAKELLKHQFLKKAKKPAYLTELIDRYQRWAAIHPKEVNDFEDDRPNRQAAGNEEDEDLWDFGTVRPANTRGPGLRTMNDAAANARSMSKDGVSSPYSKSKTADTGLENDVFSTPSTVRIPALKTADLPPFPPSPSKVTSNGPDAAGIVSPSKVPLPATPLKSPIGAYSQADPSARKPVPSSGSPTQRKNTESTDFAATPNIASLTIGDGASDPRSTTDCGSPSKQRASPLKPGSSDKALPSAPKSDALKGGTPIGATEPNSSTSLNSNPSTADLELNRGPDGEEVTALSVLGPALQAAIQRRQYNLTKLHQQSVKATSLTEQQELLDQRRRQTQVQENIRVLAKKVQRLFTDIDLWDRHEPVGMGGGVTTFLEGFLEEVLVRVEAVDEE